jgi:plasmid stabilization system protein ParE
VGFSRIIDVGPTEPLRLLLTDTARADLTASRRWLASISPSAEARFAQAFMPALLAQVNAALMAGTLPGREDEAASLAYSRPVFQHRTGKSKRGSVARVIAASWGRCASGGCA